MKIDFLLHRRTWLTSEVLKLVEAAATVANAIQCGVGSTIKGTLMEAELRSALGLAKNEYVDFSVDVNTREHKESPDCWCNPTLDYVDPESGRKVYVHHEKN